MLWTSSAFRRITDCFNDSRRPAALSLLDDADDGTSRRCQVAARPSNAESAQNRRLFTPGFAAASASNTHLAAKISHLSAHQYPLDAPSNLRNRFVRTHSMHSVATSPWHNNKMHRICRHCSMTLQITRGSTDATSENFDHLSATSNNLGQRNDFNRQTCIKYSMVSIIK